MKNISINTDSLRNTLKAISKYGENVRKRAGLHIEKTALNIEDKAKSRVAVRTGNLRANIYRNVNKEQLSANVGTNVRYAPYVEFGTGTLVNVPAGLESYAIQFKGKGVRQVNLPARPFLFNSTEEERKNYETGLRNILKIAHK